MVFSQCVKFFINKMLLYQIWNLKVSVQFEGWMQVFFPFFIQ